MESDNYNSKIVKKYWEAHILHDLPLPNTLPEMRHLIVESWIRSKNSKVDLHSAAIETIGADKLLSVLDSNHLFIGNSLSYLEKRKDLILNKGHTVVLTDKNGYVLKIIPDHNETGRVGLAGINVGSILSEDTVGTSGIGLCLAHKAPLTVSGYEHYRKQFHDCICYAAPVFDGTDLLGSIALISPLNEAPFYALGLITAVADEIGKQLEIKRSRIETKAITDAMQFIMNSTSSGILFLDSEGFIYRHNDQAAVILANESLLGKNLRDLIADPQIVNKLLSGKLNTPQKTVALYPHMNNSVIISTVYSAETSNDTIVVLNTKKGSRQHIASSFGGFNAKYTFDSFIGDSAKIRSIKELGMIAANSDANILIFGESGTGKEILAQSIHNASRRRNGPFVAINCASIPQSLIESELFGYEPGSFTGANKIGSPGKFELADGGTLFLDEIGEMPLKTQPSLLRVIQNNEVLRVGGTSPKKINVRIISATNKDLHEMVLHKHFRDDLFYRINVLMISIPPLRERTEDIPSLVEYFLKKHDPSASIDTFPEEHMQKYYAYDWPGNVRELENAVERYSVTKEAGFISTVDANKTHPASFNIKPIDVPFSHNENENGNDSVFSSPAGSPVNERLQIIKVLKLEHGHVPSAAKHLNFSTRTLYRKIEKYNIDLKSFQVW